MRMRFNKDDSGQALVEMSFGFIIMCVFVFGAIDFGRAIYDSEVMKNLAGEGSAMGAQGTQLPTVVQNVVNYAGADIDIKNKGCVIGTQVTNQGGSPPVLAITAQTSICGITAASKIGCVSGQAGCHSSNPTLPAGASAALAAEPTGSILTITEVYLNFSPITPIAGLMKGNLLPSQMYAVAYY